MQHETRLELTKIIFHEICLTTEAQAAMIGTAKKQPVSFAMSLATKKKDLYCTNFSTGEKILLLNLVFKILAFQIGTTETAKKQPVIFSMRLTTTKKRKRFLFDQLGHDTEDKSSSLAERSYFILPS